MARRARKRIPTALRSFWRRATSSLPGVAALGLALGLGIGLGLWLSETVDKRLQVNVQAAISPVAKPEAAKTAPAVPRPSPDAPPPRIAVAPWVPDPRTVPPPRLHLPESATKPDLSAPPAVLSRPEAVPLWRRNAVPPPATQGRPMVAVVIDDMGVDQRRSARTVDLPAPLTLAYLPYARDLARQTAAARGRGHELLVHVPMQPQGGNGVYDNPGPNALVVGLSPEDIRRRLSQALGAFDGYVGINNHMGSRFTSDAPGMAIVMAELRARGLLFLDSRTSPTSKGEAAAASAGVTHVGRQVFLDNEQSAAEVHARLAETERIAKARGAAIAIGHPHAVTIAALTEWLPRLHEKGLVLVPISAIAARAEDQRRLAAGAAH